MGFAYSLGFPEGFGFPWGFANFWRFYILGLTKAPFGEHVFFLGFFLANPSLASEIAA